MAPQILSLASIPLPERTGRITRARLIFEETAPTLSNLEIEARRLFEKKYFGTYLDTPESFFLATKGDLVLGYLAGAPRTLPLHYELNPYLETFRAEIEDRFPAHLHLNLTAAARGLGLGSRLIAEFMTGLAKRSPAPRGVHVVTSRDSDNVSFYLKNKFKPTTTSGTLLLMGRAL